MSLMFGPTKRWKKCPNEILRCLRPQLPHMCAAGTTLKPSLFSEKWLLFRSPMTILLSSLRCCRYLMAIKAGKEIHGYVIRNLGCSDVRSESSIVNFYAKCGLFVEARQVCDKMLQRDVVSWTVMIMACADRPGFESEVLNLFEKMQCNNAEPNQRTLSVVLGCAHLCLGRQLHGLAIKRNWEENFFVGSALIEMYAKNEILNHTHLVFDQIEEKDLVCFNSLILGYGRLQHVKGVILMFEEIGLAGLSANQSTYVGVLNGCANLGTVQLGRKVHAHLIISGNEHDAVIQGVLVNMYSKCGSLDASRSVFDRMSGTKSLVAWNSMIGGYGKHGYGEEALQVFRQWRQYLVVLTISLSRAFYLHAVTLAWLKRGGNCSMHWVAYMGCNLRMSTTVAWWISGLSRHDMESI